jgi:hypothetical protein
LRPGENIFTGPFFFYRVKFGPREGTLESLWYVKVRAGSKLELARLF